MLQRVYNEIIYNIDFKSNFFFYLDEVLNSHLFRAQYNILTVLFFYGVIQIWRVFSDHKKNVTLWNLQTTVLKHNCSAGIWLILTPELDTAVASCELLDLLVAVNLQLFTKGNFKDQHDLTRLFGAWIVHRKISAVTYSFAKFICEVKTISKHTIPSVLAVYYLYGLCEDA